MQQLEATDGDEGVIIIDMPNPKNSNLWQCSTNKVTITGGSPDDVISQLEKRFPSFSGTYIIDDIPYVDD
jgi:hypothetical protein